MASLKVHEEDCIQLLGEPYSEVHRWLDFYADKFPPPLFSGYHRSFRHNSRGLKIIFEIFSGRAVAAAKIHLVRDWEMFLLRGPIQNLSLKDIEARAQEALILGNSFYDLDCPVPPHFIDAEHQNSGMSWSAIMNIYNKG